LGKFGEICVTIDREEFVNRVKEFFGVSSYPEIVCDDVIYYDPKLSQQTTSHSFLYKTKEEFEEEEEFRICINFKELLRKNQIEKLEVVNIDIGSLEDIASINFNY
jgi:site-specific DNA-adenine methylase